jgi:sortase B
MLKGAAGRADISAEEKLRDVLRETERGQSHKRDDISAILDEVEAKRHATQDAQPNVEYSSGRTEASAGRRVRREAVTTAPAERPKAAVRHTDRPRPETHTVTREEVVSEAAPRQRKENGKKKRNQYTFKEILQFFVPWKGDSVFESMRKIVFSLALIVVGVCTFLIGSYYIDLYKAKKMYQELQARIDEAKANRHFSNDSFTEDPVTGEMIEWLDYNDYATRLLPINPDMVGYISIEGTKVSYPVVQRKSNDPAANDYYLNRTFKQEYSKSGCIFMDYRNHFDEVVDHRRVVDNSGNVFIYGHNMGNGTMFGTLHYYISNPSFYSAHPIVDYSSLYKDYQFKIFAVFIVDGEDYTSEYAFDCWNTLDFADEDAFYDYVNEAKKRTLINNQVDVKYGDQLLSLFTCNGLVQNAKLILMCRELRAGEDPLEGTENATLNENVLYPAAYYKYGKPVNYDPKKFVPYGPNS